MSSLVKIRSRVSKFVRGFAQTVGFLSAVLTLLIFLGVSTAVFGNINHTLPLIIVGIAIAIISVLLFIILYTLLQEITTERFASGSLSGDTIKEGEKSVLVATDTISYPPPPPEDVEIIRKEIVYEYLPDGKTMYQRKHIQMRVLQNGVGVFKDRYRWTGSGQCTINSLTPGYKIGNHHKAEEGIWDYFDVIFPHPKHKDDIVEVTIEWELFDEKGFAVPFLSTMIDRETKYLLLQVRLPNEQAPKNAYYYEYKNYIDTLPIISRPIQWSPATKCITYEVPKPEKYHKYLIRWYTE